MADLLTVIQSLCSHSGPGFKARSWKQSWYSFNTYPEMNVVVKRDVGHLAETSQIYFLLVLNRVRMDLHIHEMRTFSV